MVNVNKCKDIWQFYPLLKQMLATNPDGFQEFVEANFENAQDVYNMFEGGVSQDSTSPVLEEIEHTDSDSTPQEMQFAPSRPSHTVEETLLDTDTLMLGGARLGILFTDFKRRIVSASILDLQTGEPILNQNKTCVGANEMTGLNRTILNTNIGKYKLELLNKVSKYIGGPVYKTMEEACEVDENGMYKWESTLQEFASRETDTNSPEYMSARESAVILKQFDNWLASNAPFIRIATPYKDTHLFNPDRYVYVGPSTKMFQSFSSDEYMDAHKYGLSDLVKTIVDVFPEYTEEGKPIPGTQVGVDGMNSIGTKLKHYFQNSGNAETRARWYKRGVNRDWNKLFEDYIKFVNTSKSSASAIAETETDKDITTLTTKMYGLQKLFAILPNDLKILFSHTIDKIVASEYRAAEVETTKVGEDTIVYGRAKNYSERPQTTWKSYIKDCVLGASMLLRTTPSMKAALNQKYKIEFKDNSIYVNGKPFVKSTESGWSLVETDHDLIKALAQDVLQFPIPEEYSEIHAFFPAAANVKAKKGMPAWGKLVATVLVNGYAPLNNMMNPHDGSVAEIAKVMSVIYGSESATVVKNQKGNNLPMHQVTCLAYRHLDVVEHMKHLDDASINRVESNLIFQNSRQVLTPQCRTDFISGSSRHKTSTSFSKLNARDSLACSMIFDFWKPLFEQDSDNHGRIALQAHTYADKSKQLLQRFDLRRPWKIGDREVDFLSLLQQICNGNKDAIVEMANIWRELEKEQINHTVQNIISDFSEVYGKKFTTIKGVNDFLVSQIKNADGTTETRSLESVRKDFLEAGVPFIENYHAVVFDGKVRINECITTFHKTVNDDTLWKEFYTNQFNSFKESAREALIPAAHLFTVKNGDQYTPYDMRGKQEKGKEDYIPLNFVAAAYFLANNIFEGQYNRLMVGDYYLHDNKAKGTTDPSVAAASRYISQIKRMVIYGATTHTYAQDLDNGVKSTVNVAVMEDLPSSVQNMLGETATMDSCDGSGLTSPYYSRMENNSLLDAAVKDVKKTIMHDVGANGVPVLLKWAEYAITNEKRRMSYGSDVPYNHIFNKMHSHPVYVPESEILQTAEAKTIYYRDQNTGEHHKRVIKIYNENGNNVAAYYDFVVDINGKTISEPVAYKESFKTLADLDAIFGGCWSESFNENNELVYSESSLDEVFDLIVKYDWRDKMIGIVANKSAVKVGVQNLNSVEAWTSPNDDRNPLYYFSMSTKFGGLQMDADHDLEDSDVTEMTQMISALVQNGYSIEIADKVYRDIGAYCVESIADIREALKDVDSDKLFQIFGKAIVEAFATGDKDTLGLAQAFIAIATKNMQESGLKPIPFSSMSINGIFNSTVTTTLVKKAIRRHYEGVAAVLNPSFGSIQIYNIEGSTYTYPELLDWYLSHKTIDRKTWSLTQLLNVAEFNGFINPTYKVVDPTTYIDFEDTITWKNADGTWSSHKVTDYKTYWEARRIIKDHDKVYIKTLAPKNLKGADTKFTLATTDGTGATATRNSSMFETVYAQLLYATYNIKANTTEDVVNQVKATLADLLGVANDTAWEETFNVKYKDILVNAFGNLGMNSEYSYKRLRRRLAKSQQKFLGELHKAQENISESDPIYTFNMDGAEYNISAVEVVPAQIIMGRYYAKQFGLSAGDSIGKIRNDENFFFNKAKTQYKTDADSNVDLVLYDGQGDQIHVIYDPDGRKTQSIAGQLSRCNGFTIVDGNVYYKDKLLCNNENKQFYSYKVGDVEHKVVIVSHLNALSDLIKNDWTDYTECLYRQDNASWILNAVRGKTISENLVTIETKSENGPIVTTVNISTPEGIKSLLEEEKTLKNRHIGHIAFSRKKSFEKSLNFIGTRIPCQSMQSFAPMRVAAFSNSTTNEVFVPTNIMWLEGSDLDIDKQYILGYSISDSGRIFDGEGDHHKEDRLKNNVVDNIWKTVTDPRNQINLTQPISTDDFKAIAAKSSRGKLAEGMSIYNPFHKYSMQVENMVGRDCIGSVATALKGFFALTYMYNMRMNEMCDAIESGNINEAERLFNRYFKQPLANVNVERLDYVLTLLPEGDFKNRLLALKDKVEDQEDMSMLMGQLLNAATDNAKELILKKINADSTWIDLYTSAFMEGKSLEEVSSLMLNPRSQQIFDGFDSSVFAGNRPFGKLPYLTGVKLETKGEDPILDQLIDQAELAEETRVLGRFLKINQGLITNRAEMLAYVGDIQAFVEKRFEKSTDLKECRKYLNKLNEDKALTEEEAIRLDRLLSKDFEHDFEYDINTEEGKLAAQQALQDLIADEIIHTRFDVYRFASDSYYRDKCIKRYENCKVKFNILEAVATSPHFDKMFGMVSTNEDILTSLSARNRLEGLVVDRYRQQARLENWSNGNINASTAKNLKDRVDDVLRKDWILEQGIEIPIIKGQRYWNGTKFVEAGSTKQTRLAINDEKQILSLRQFLENIVIPRAKEQHPENKFLSSITMGLQGGIQYWRPMINMSTVSQSIKTKEQYEGMANDFAKLADVNFVVDGIDTGHTIVDWIYLYNLIVNRDRFGATTFTRFFESLVPTGRVDYFAFDFANWLDKIDVEQTFENHRAEFLRYAYEDDPESDTYADHFGIRGKEAIVEDSETFDPWDELKYNSGATDKEIEGYKQRADKLYIVPVVSVNNPSSRQMSEDFSWSGNKQKWIVTFEGDASYQVLSGLKTGDSVTFGKNTVQIQAPLRKWINDGELETVGVAKVQTPAIDAKNLSTPSSFHAFSGAADGADTEWKEIAKLWGIDTTDYTVESYDALDSNWKNTIEEAYQKAVKYLGRFAYGPNTVGGKLVRRDYLQVIKADAVFAAGKIVAPGEVGLPNSKGKVYENKTSHDVVDGGTGYAVQMAIDMGKPVHVFDPYRKGWYTWNGSSFVKEEVPKLTPKFAAVGSRNLVELPGEEWVRAKLSMRRVFEKTAEKYGWDKSGKAKVDLISFNDMTTMKQHSSSIPNGVVTIRQSGDQHYGNPFTHISDSTKTTASVILPTVKDAAAAYKAWLLGESSFTTSEGKTIDISNVEPERRKWIQNQISSGALDGKTLIYYTTKIGSPNGYKTPDGKAPVYFSDEYPSHAHVLKELINSRSSSNGGNGSVVDGRVTPESVAKLPEFSGLPPFTVNLISLGAYNIVGRNELAERVKPVDGNMPEYNRIIKASPQYIVMQNIYRDPIKFYDSTDADLDKLGISEDLKTRAKLLKDKMKGSLIINPEATLGQKGQNLENVKIFRDLDIEFSKFLSDVASEVWGVKLLEEPKEYAQNKPIPKLKELQKVVSNGGNDNGDSNISEETLQQAEQNSTDLSNTPIYRGYATMSENEAVDLDETVAGTAMDYIKGFDAGYHFTSSRSEAHDYATGRTDKSEETFMNDEGQVITQQNRHYRGDYAHVSAYTIDPSAKVVYFDDVLEANAHPELMRDADVIVLKQGTLGSTNTEYIVRKGAKHLVHKIESSNIESPILTPSKEDLPLKIGSVVEYNNELYLVRGFSSSGGLQLIKTDGSNYSGTPQPNKITAVKHQYPVISHNGTDYIVTNNDNIYTLAKSTKGSRLVFTADASNVGKDRNFLISRASVHRGKARFHESQNYIVTEEGVVYKSTGELYNSEYAKTIAKETYPEKFTTEPIVPVSQITREFKLTEGQQLAAQEVVEYLEGRGKNSVICINGAAGTGKTTVIDYILEQMKEHGTLPDGPIVVSSISNQATSNLYNKIKAVPVSRQTIASFEGAAKVDETAEFEFSENFAKAHKLFSEPAIMFVDEVSMLGKKDFEILLHHVEQYGMKLVLIGDINQLPPIEKDENGFDRIQSVVFDENQPISHVHLSERVRQGEDSPILAYSDLYRTEGQSDNFEKTTTIEDNGAVIFDSGDISKYISLFEWAKDHKSPNFVKFCASTHILKNMWNTTVHNILFPGQENKFVVGENIILYSTARDEKDRAIISYNNSDSLIIDDIQDVRKETFTIGGGSITVELATIIPQENAFNYHEPKSFVTCSNMSDMEALFGKKLTGDKDPSCFISKARTYLNKKYNYKPWRSEDPEVITFKKIEQIVAVNFGYACTIHKAQGSTYDIAIVTTPQHYFGQKDKMAYTAITRARNMVIVTDSHESFNEDLLSINKTIEQNRQQPKNDPSMSISTTPKKFSSETKAQLKELIAAIDSPYLKEVTDADLEGVDDFTADAEGFVKDGIIYINTDRASVGTVIHELGHLYLGALKSDPEKREHYYDILANMHEYCDLWHEMQGNQFYANKRGSDFDEEIAARLIEMYYNGSIMSERDKALAQELIMISGINLENLPKPEKMQWMSENYKIKQSVATLKNKLYEDEVIKDIDC